MWLLWPPLPQWSECVPLLVFISRTVARALDCGPCSRRRRVQGKHMDTTISLGGGSVFNIPPASMALFDTLSIIVLIPIYDGIVHPIMKRLRCDLTLLQRIGWGFLVAALAMVVAGVVERRRIIALAMDPPQNIPISMQVPLPHTLPPPPPHVKVSAATARLW